MCTTLALERNLSGIEICDSWSSCEEWCLSIVSFETKIFQFFSANSIFFTFGQSQFCERAGTLDAGPTFFACLVPAGLPDGILHSKNLNFDIFFRALEWNILVNFMAIWYFLCR
jgi:hypothetical protein